MPADVVWVLSAFALGVVVTAITAMTLSWRARRRRARLSRAVRRGQNVEQLAPHLAGFPGAAADARFLGAPIDYVVFDGLEAGDDVVVQFVEVKTGKSKLSPREKAVRDAVKAGRVRWMTLRL